MSDFERKQRKRKGRKPPGQLNLIEDSSQGPELTKKSQMAN